MQYGILLKTTCVLLKQQQTRFLQDSLDEPTPEQLAVLDFYVQEVLLTLLPILKTTGWHASSQYCENEGEQINK